MIKGQERRLILHEHDDDDDDDDIIGKWVEEFERNLRLKIQTKYP